MTEPRRCAPVILFVYTRLFHTQQTVAALAANELARCTDLVVYSDGPRSERDLEKVSDVRAFLRQIKGFSSVRIVERPRNFGLAENIIQGVSEICEEYGRVIVVEDDLITSPHFLSYMNDCLDLYAEEELVYSVSGCCYPVDNHGFIRDVFFLRIPLCWGWATWRSKWALFDKDLAAIERVPPALKRYINFNGAYDFFWQATANMTGQINTWFIFWYLALARNGKLAVFPPHTLVRNIGMDGTGENSGRTSMFDERLALNPVRVVYQSPKEDPQIVELHKTFFEALGRKRGVRGFARSLLRRLAALVAR